MHIFPFLWMLLLIPPHAYGTTTGSTNSYIHVPEKILPDISTKGTIKVARNMTLNECAAECSLEYMLSQFPCFAFEYTKRDKTCLMTNVTTLVTDGGYLSLRHESATDYFERPKGEYNKLFQPFPHQVLQQEATYYAVFRNKSLEECALFCLEESRKPCMSFSYSESKQACGLSSVFYAADNGQRLRHSQDYNHYQYYTAWPCNATIPWNYSPRAIASPYFPYASLKDVNCYLILEAPDGKQLDLQFSTFYTKSSLCKVDGGIFVYDGRSSSAPFMSKLCSSDNFVDRRYQSSSGNLFIEFSTGRVPLAFKGVYDFIEVDVCAKTPCANNGTCHASSGRYNCECMLGFTGNNCEINIDECASSPCYLGGQCIDKIDAFECKCPSLLGGPRCNVFVGLCYLKPCQNGGTCSPRGTNRYICDCPEGYTGQNCTDKLKDPCNDLPCLNGAHCTSNMSEKSYTCTCQHGFTGTNCETNIDECASSPCLHQFQCHDLINDYRCDCPTILGGKNCELFLGACSSTPCLHGRCTPAGPTNYTCECDDSYSGENCTERVIDFCDPSPCKHGKCLTTTLGPSCNCNFGYTGFFCDTKINYCENVDCHQGECKNLEGDFRCSCIPGYEGRFCNKTTNHCKSADCNGGFCINTITSHFCVCKDGHTGEKCEPTLAEYCSTMCTNGTCVTQDRITKCVCGVDFTGTWCDVPVDYCITKPCVHGRCNSISGGYTCTCDKNYTGKTCNNVIDYCLDNKCLFGFCIGRENGYDCLCGQGYHGQYCDIQEGETTSPVVLTTATTLQSTAENLRCSSGSCMFGSCDPDFQNVCVCYQGYTGEMCDAFVGCDLENPCRHGNCSEVNNSYQCVCQPGYSGEKCEVLHTDQEPCLSVSCQNGGICYSFNQSESSIEHQCICIPGYHGPYCEYRNTCSDDVCKTGSCIPMGNGFRCQMASLSGSSNTSAIKLTEAILSFLNKVISSYKASCDTASNQDNLSNWPTLLLVQHLTAILLMQCLIHIFVLCKTESYCVETKY